VNSNCQSRFWNFWTTALGDGFGTPGLAAGRPAVTPSNAGSSKRCRTEQPVVVRLFQNRNCRFEFIPLHQAGTNSRFRRALRSTGIPHRLRPTSDVPVLDLKKQVVRPRFPALLPTEPNMPRLFDAACFIDRDLTHRPRCRYPTKLGQERHMIVMSLSCLEAHLLPGVQTSSFVASGNTSPGVSFGSGRRAADASLRPRASSTRRHRSSWPWFARKAWRAWSAGGAAAPTKPGSDSTIGSRCGRLAPASSSSAATFRPRTASKRSSSQSVRLHLQHGEFFLEQRIFGRRSVGTWIPGRSMRPHRESPQPLGHRSSMCVRPLWRNAFPHFHQ
jgi:hypothetical protein